MENKKRVQRLSSVEDPLKVKVLILADQKTTYSDFFFIARFTNIVKLDLSYNKLNSFTVGFCFANFHSLKTLFLHYNKFSSLKAVQSVSECKKLEYLTLFGNPLEETKTRHYFVNQILSLKLMDDKIIRMQERNTQILSNRVQKVVKLSFPIVPVPESKDSSYFLAAVITELRIIRQKYIECNPIIKIQRWYRNMLRKRRIKLTKKQKLVSQQSVINKLDIKLDEQIKNQISKQRLKTEKFQIFNSKQQKVLSLLMMNMEFFSFLREKSAKKVFATKKFCDQVGLKYQLIGKKLLALRVPSELQSENKNQLQLIFKSCQRFLLRRIGSQSSMNLHKKSKISKQLITKRKKRQRSYLNKIKLDQPNQNLVHKIEKIEYDYCNRLVMISEQPDKIYECMKQQYYKSIQNKRTFPFCLQEIVERSVAAVSIQRMWKGYAVRKKIFNAVQRITKNNAAWLVQRFIRNLGIRKRNLMFIQLIDYIKKQNGSSQIILNMKNVLALQQKYRDTLIGVNFALPDQKVNFKIDQFTQQIYLQSQQFKRFPQHLRNYITGLERKQGLNKNKQASSILDILFQGAISVKYFTANSAVSNDQNLRSPKIQNNNAKQAGSPDKSLGLSRSLTKLANSGVILINSSKYQKDSRQPVISKNQLQEQSSTNNYAIFEYLSVGQAINRKFMLALLTYKYLNNSFIKSQRFNLNENNIRSIKSINERINECHFMKMIDEQNQSIDLLQSSFVGRQLSNPMRLKLFVDQQDHSVKIQLLLPISSTSKNVEKKKDISMTLPIRSNQQVSLVQSKGQIKTNKQRRQIRHSAQLTKNVIKMYPDQKADKLSQASNMLSYRQFSQRYDNKFTNRYEDLQSGKQKNKSLQKSQSMQPSGRKKQQRSSLYFQTLAEDTQKNYATQVYLQSLTEDLRNKLTNYDKSIGYSSIGEDEKQFKKKKITLLKQSHRQRIQQNNRYKKQQLSKLRQKLNDESEQYNRIIQSNKLEGILSNARKHNKVKLALSQKVEEIHNFERDFLKRGNSSIRKDMIKFQHDRTSSKSPENQSVYQSLKSLQSEVIKNNLIKKPNKIFNLKTEIKQFSIDGSDGDPDMSIGAIQSENKSKGLKKKLCEQQKQMKSRQKSKERQLTARPKNISKDLKKKKLVHSVFPQQFYPLKQTKKIGFELPRINKK